MFSRILKYRRKVTRFDGNPMLFVQRTIVNVFTYFIYLTFNFVLYRDKESGMLFNI